ncbi:hypothetical protein [Streptomyces sp. NPDC058653]|uniref:hypothetical protein n=1 Tax=Streptomyces sp. NPDC058653 TaxID=3346576 RepID=UPI00365EA673
MPRPPRAPHTPNWPYVVLTVLLVAISSGWTPADIKILGVLLLPLIAVAYATHRQD